MNIELGNKHELDAQTLRDFAEQFGDSNGESEITSKSDVPKARFKTNGPSLGSQDRSSEYSGLVVIKNLCKNNVKNLTAESDSDEKKEENWWDAIGKLFN